MLVRGIFFGLLGGTAGKHIRSDLADVQTRYDATLRALADIAERMKPLTLDETGEPIIDPLKLTDSEWTSGADGANMAFGRTPTTQRVTERAGRSPYHRKSGASDKALRHFRAATL